MPSDQQRHALHRLRAMGGRVIPLGTKDKRHPKGKHAVGPKCECQIAYSHSMKHQPECKSYYATGLSDQQADSLFDAHTRTEPRLGIVPSTVGVFAVDVDGSDGKPSEPEEAAATFLWSQHFGRKPDAVVETANRGKHLLWRTDCKTNGVRGTWAAHAWIDGARKRICGGDIRYHNGYVCLYDPSEMLRVAEIDDPAEPKSFRKDDLYRNQRAAGLFIEAARAEAQRNPYMLREIKLDVEEGAIDSPDAWKIAYAACVADRADWETAQAEIQRAWDWAVDNTDDPKPFDNWRRGISQRTAKREFNKSEWDERRERVINACPLDHESEPADMLNDALGKALPNIRYFDSELHTLAGVVWIPIDRFDAQAVLKHTNEFCDHHSREFTGPVVLNAKRKGAFDMSPDYRTLLIGGGVKSVVPRQEAARRHGINPREAHHLKVMQLVFDAQPDDKLTVATTFDLGDKPPNLPAIPRILADFGIYAGIGDAELIWLLDWIATGLGDPLKSVPLILAESNTGKGVISTALRRILGELVMPVTAVALDKFASSNMIKSAFVIAEESQGIRPQVLEGLKQKAGGGADIDRRMGVSGMSKECRASFMMIAERDKFNFADKAFKGGWVNRWHPIIGEAQHGSRMPGQVRDELLTDINVRELAWCILNRQIRPYANPTPDMLDARDAIVHAMNSESGTLEFDVNGQLMHTGRQTDSVDEATRQEFAKAEELPW